MILNGMSGKGFSLIYPIFSKFSASLAKLDWAYLYNFTSLINLTIRTIRPALVPTLEALPARASQAAEVAPAPDDDDVLNN